MLRELRFLLWLRRFMREERVDFVHGFTIKCAVYGSLAARSLGLARVSAVAGLGYVFISRDLRARVLRPVVRGLMRLAFGGRRARLILQNPDDVMLFQRAGLVCREGIRLIPGSGVDTTRFCPGKGCRERFGLSADVFAVLLPARMLWDKGVEEFVKAARKLRLSGRVFSFLLAGDPDPGNPAAVPESRLRAWEAEGIVRWLGHVEDMPGLLRSVDAVVLPSYREGLPKGLIEAAACGKPLITSNVPGCREVVTDSLDGLLVPARDPQTLASAILRLADDKDLCVRLGAASRERSLAEFDERIVIDRTLSVYVELLGSGFAGDVVKK